MTETTQYDGPTRPIAMDEIVSSQIHSIGHDASSNTLAICFKGKDGGPGSVYHYGNFTADDFEAFKGAESVGSFFYKHIKPAKDKYPYSKIESVPAVTEEQA